MTGSDAAKRLEITHARERTYCRTRSRNDLARAARDSGRIANESRGRAHRPRSAQGSAAAFSRERCARWLSRPAGWLVRALDRSHPLDDVFDRVASALERTRRAHSVVRPEPFE